MIKSNIKVPAPSKKFVYKISALVLIVLLVIIALAGAPLKKVPADKIALSYGGGLFEGAQYQDTIEPGSSLKFNGFYDKWYEYPTTQRNFILTDSGEGEEQSGGIDFSTVLLNQRNHKWIPKIALISAEKSTFFAVGAGHLPGKDGVLTLLRKAGYRVTAVL